MPGRAAYRAAMVAAKAIDWRGHEPGLKHVGIVVADLADEQGHGARPVVTDGRHDLIDGQGCVLDAGEGEAPLRPVVMTASPA